MNQKTKFKETEIGEIPEDWEVRQFKEILIGNIKHGIYKSKEYFRESPVKILKMGVQYGNARIGNQQMDSIVVTGGELKRFKIETGNLMFSRTSMMTDGAGKCSLVIEHKNPIVFDGNILCAVLNNKLAHPEYFYYQFNSKLSKDELSKITAGTQSRNISGSNLMKLLIIIPPMPEQQAIAKIFSDLDSKIELLQKQNQTLEKIGQALFKHWFVDFEFPNEGKPYKSSGGKMVDSELGEIPKGWEVRKLGDFIFVERGLSYKGSGLCEDGIPMINLGNIAPNNHFRYEGLKFYAGEYKERNLVKPGDLVIANTDITQKREVLGSCLVVPADLGSDKIIFTHHIYVVRHKNSKLSNHFLSFLLQIPEYRERATGFATGTTVLALPEDAILNFNFVLPPEHVTKKYNLLVTHIKNKASLNIIESKNLSKIRDSLLPKLMSGKIRVPIEVKQNA